MSDSKLKITQGFNEKKETKLQASMEEMRDKLINYMIDESEFLIPIIVITSLVIFVSYQIYTALNDQDPINNLSKYIYLTSIPIVTIFAYIVYITFDNKSKYIFYAICGLVVILFCMIYGFIKINEFKLNLTLKSIVSYSFSAIIILFGLSIFYNIFENELRSNDTWGSFIIEMIFYIPCMIDDFIKYIAQDYANTSTRTIIMFGIEIILIIYYFYLYPIYKNSIYDNGVVVMKEPVFLNKKISRLIEPIKDIDANRVEPPVQYDLYGIIRYIDPTTYSYRKNYAISMWVYINPMPMNRIGYRQETNIFCYGTNDIHYASQNSWEINKEISNGTTPNNMNTIPKTRIKEYHPKLSMAQEKNTYVFNFYYSGSTPTHQLELPLQKWNNIVFNYLSNGVDVFINGELTLSYNFSDDMPNYTEDDDIYIGEDKNEELLMNNIKANGLYGSVCNIVYYKHSLTKRDIILNYNMLSLNNPPIIS